MQLSELAGISRSGLRHIESGNVQPSLVNVLRIARALGIRWSDLIDYLDRD